MENSFRSGQLLMTRCVAERRMSYLLFIEEELVIKMRTYLNGYFSKIIAGEKLR